MFKSQRNHYKTKFLIKFITLKKYGFDLTQYLFLLFLTKDFNLILLRYWVRNYYSAINFVLKIQIAHYLQTAGA
jgi:hypothetical protein